MTDETSPSQDGIIESFLQHCTFQDFRAKQLILPVGHPSDRIYYVMEGSVSVLLGESDMVEEEEGERELLLAFLSKGDFFGEMGLLDESQVCSSALIRARLQCRIASMTYEQLKSMDDVFIGLLSIIAKQLSQRLYNTSRMAGSLVFMNVKGRVANSLLHLSHGSDAMTHPDGMLIKMTRQELAKLVGCSREIVGKMLKILEEEGLISVSGKSIVVYRY